jgi:hypothetical protein
LLGITGFEFFIGCLFVRMLDEKLTNELQSHGVYTTNLQSNEHATYFGNVGKLRFNQQIALINNKAKILLHTSEHTQEAQLENVLTVTKDKLTKNGGKATITQRKQASTQFSSTTSSASTQSAAISTLPAATGAQTDTQAASAAPGAHTHTHTHRPHAPPPHIPLLPIITNLGKTASTAREQTNTFAQLSQSRKLAQQQLNQQQQQANTQTTSPNSPVFLRLPSNPSPASKSKSPQPRSASPNTLSRNDSINSGMSVSARSTTSVRTDTNTDTNVDASTDPNTAANTTTNSARVRTPSPGSTGKREGRRHHRTHSHHSRSTHSHTHKHGKHSSSHHHHHNPHGHHHHHTSNSAEWATHSDSDDEIEEMAMLSDPTYKHSLQALCLSPRSRFIAGCLHHRINPRPAMVIRNNFSTSLQLAHMCMGDELARLLADSLQSLPHIQAVDIADNNLTDVGLTPLIDAMVKIPQLLQFDGSRNEIGPLAAAALGVYLSICVCVCVCVCGFVYVCVCVCVCVCVFACLFTIELIRLFA